MDTAGKAVLFSGITVLISLSAVMLVPSPAFRSMSLGIMLAVLFVLAATLTLLPAVLAKLGPRIDKLSLPWVHSGEHRSAALRRLGRAVVAPSLPLWGPGIGGPRRADRAGDRARHCHALDQGCPLGRLIASRLPNRCRRRSGRARLDRCSSSLRSRTRAPFGSDRERPGIAQVTPAARSGNLALIQAIPKQDPSNPAVGVTIDRLRSDLPAGTLIGGAVAENHDLQAVLSAKTPLVIGVVLGLGFVLLLFALQAPLIAAAGVITNLLATGAAFGVAKWIFQDGALHSVLGFEPQGFLDAWGPVFFFAMIFAISMDYTVFLLSSAREHWDRTDDAKEAMVGGLAHSGRVIFAAGAVMVAVFFTFALSGPLPPKEMGLILGIAVLLDAMLIRLLLMPVLLRLLGPWAWYLPRWADRVLPDVRFGHGEEARSRA